MGFHALRLGFIGQKKIQNASELRLEQDNHYTTGRFVHFDSGI